MLYLRRQTVKGSRSGVSLTLPPGARKALISFVAWKLKERERLTKRVPLFVSRKGFRLSRKRAHEIFTAAYEKVGLKGHVTTHSPRKTYAKMVYQNSGNNLMVTQQALRHTSIETTLYYLNTLKDEVTSAMPNFDFEPLAQDVCRHGEPDELDKTSNSKIIDFQQAAKRQGRREAGKRSEDGRKRIS